MTALQVALLVVGLVCLVGSFFVSEKLSSSDLEEMKNMSQQEIQIILESELNQASSDIEDKLRDKLEEKLEEMERKSDKETNQKIMSISEYSDTVLNAMNKSHDEIVFMYDMLNDKQEKATELTKELQQMESAVNQMRQSLDEKIEQVQLQTEKSIEIVQENEEIEKMSDISVQEALQHQMEEKEEKEGHRDNGDIISLYKKGYSEVEIAKKLGRGLGEVKLILGLFSEENKS